MLDSYKQACFCTEMRISVDSFTSSPRPFAAVLRRRHCSESFPEMEARTGVEKGQSERVTKWHQDWNWIKLIYSTIV